MRLPEEHRCLKPAGAVEGSLEERRMQDEVQFIEDHVKGMEDLP